VLGDLDVLLERLFAVVNQILVQGGKTKPHQRAKTFQQYRDEQHQSLRNRQSFQHVAPAKNKRAEMELNRANGPRTQPTDGAFPTD
jgi:hypothetical protein